MCICSSVGSIAVSGNCAASVSTFSISTFFDRTGSFALEDVDLPTDFVLRILSEPAASTLFFFATTKIPPSIALARSTELATVWQIHNNVSNATFRFSLVHHRFRCLCSSEYRRFWLHGNRLPAWRVAIARHHQRVCPADSALS